MSKEQLESIIVESIQDRHVSMGNIRERIKKKSHFTRILIFNISISMNICDYEITNSYVNI